MKVNPRPYIPPDELSQLKHYLAKSVGLDLNPLSFATAQLFLSAFLQETDCKSAQALVQRMETHAECAANLRAFIDFPESEMFRDPEMWETLTREVIPGALRHLQNLREENLRVWLPSCSSGEEVYSLAILACEQSLKHKLNITASSLSPIRIKEARAGIMDKRGRDLSELNYLKSGGKNAFSGYLKTIDGIMMRDKSLVEDVSFTTQQLLPGEQPAAFDIIIYRNRLCCFRPSIRETILEQLQASLRPGGHLLLGFGERIPGDDARFNLRPLDSCRQILQYINNE